jgi:hypothetical protein
MKLLSDLGVSTIVVEHRDRLMRFGAEYVEAALAAQGRKLRFIPPLLRLLRLRVLHPAERVLSWVFGRIGA